MIVRGGVEMVGVVEAARLAGRTPETIRRWIWAGRLQATKEGNRLFVPRAALGAAADTTETDLQSWAEEMLARPDVRAGASAADLVLTDREQRAGR